MVVLAMLGIGAALVAARPRAGATDPHESALTRARRLAVARAEILRFEVRTDGAWVVLAGDGTALDEGRDGGPPLSVELDALGNCQPVRSRAAAVPDRVFDPLTCRYRSEGP